MQRMRLYIYHSENWPHFTWRLDELLGLLSEVRNLQGRIMGRMEFLGFELRNEAMLDALTLDVLKTSEIEGEYLNSDQVRSSIDGFEGKLTSSKWAKIAKCSKDTAIRDINDLINKEILKKEDAGGRSTNYELR